MDAEKVLKLAQEWPDDPRPGHWIDDGALYVLMILARGMLARAGTDTFTLTMARPTEWDHKDMLKFLIRVSEGYNFPLKNHSVMTYAFAEEYEVPTIDDNGNVDPEYEQAWKEHSVKYREYEKCRKQYEHLPGGGMKMKQCFGKFPMPPKKYGGAYKWALDRAALKETEQDKMLARFFDGTFDTADLQAALRFSDKHIPEGVADDSEELYSKQICDSLVDWTSFDVDPGKEKGLQIQRDLVAYLNHFIEGDMQPYSRDRHFFGKYVRLNPNTFTFEKHKQLLVERFKEMYENYGNSFVFENPFDEVALDRQDDDSIKELYAKRQFLFMHAMLAFEQLGYIKMDRLGNNWHWAEDKSPRHEAKVLLLDAFGELTGPGKISTALSFDTNKARLYVRGHEVAIRKFSDQYHTLRIIFEKPEDVPQEWFFSEIAERVDEKKPGDKRYYNAVYQIREKLAKEGFPEFFITTKQSAKINPKYLS